MNRFFEVNNVFYDSQDDDELIDIAFTISETFAEALREKFNFYRSEIERYESEIQKLDNA